VALVDPTERAIADAVAVPCARALLHS
jgi:hypothetical protein